MYAKLVERADEEVRREEERDQRRLESRRNRLIEEGIVDVTEAQELIQDAEHELPSQLIERRLDRQAKEREVTSAQNQQKRLTDAKKVFSRTWVLDKEKEMFEYCERMDKCKDDQEMRATLKSLIEITENKLKLFHESQGTTHKEAVAERAKVCLALGYAQPHTAEYIENVYHRLPVVDLDEPLPLTPPRSEVGADEDLFLNVPPTPSWSSKTSAPILSTPPRSKVTADNNLALDVPKTPSWLPKTSTPMFDPPVELGCFSQQARPSRATTAVFLSQKESGKKRPTHSLAGKETRQENPKKAKCSRKHSLITSFFSSQS